jgi:TPP-dependent 2-oxoacid decarboxylase
MTAQEVSTMLRYRLNPIIFLINNGAYTIEVRRWANVLAIVAW